MKENPVISKGIVYIMKKTYNYYHFTNGSDYSVCAYYAIETKGWKSAYLEDTGWLDNPLTSIGGSYNHSYWSDKCPKYGCNVPSWSGECIYQDANGALWFHQLTRTIRVYVEN